MSLKKLSLLLVSGLWLLVALQPSVAAAQFGSVAPPTAWGDLCNLSGFITALLRTLIVIGGIYALLNFVIAGFQYMTAAGDAKALAAAWGRIWQSLIGLVFMVGSFVLAAIIGYLLTRDTQFILSPIIYGKGPLICSEPAPEGPLPGGR